MSSRFGWLELRPGTGILFKTPGETLLAYFMHGQRRFFCASSGDCFWPGVALLANARRIRFDLRVTMPTYEYICEKCDHEFEMFQSIKDQPLTVCPKDLCHLKKWGKGKVKKKIGSGAGIIFKGSGFYITDYRSESYKEAAKKDAPPSSGGEGKSGDSGGKKEAPKTESKPAKGDSKPPKSEK